VSEATHSPGLWPVHGDGVLARHGNLILLSSLESGQFVDVLLDLLDQVASAGGDGSHLTSASGRKHFRPANTVSNRCFRTRCRFGIRQARC